MSPVAGCLFGCERATASGCGAETGTYETGHGSEHGGPRRNLPPQASHGSRGGIGEIDRGGIS
jgi:hypothetical protein